MEGILVFVVFIIVLILFLFITHEININTQMAILCIGAAAFFVFFDFILLNKFRDFFKTQWYYCNNEIKHIEDIAMPFILVGCVIYSIYFYIRIKIAKK